MKLSKGQKIQRAMDRIIAKQEKPTENKGSGNLATTLPRKDNPLQNTNNPPVA